MARRPSRVQTLKLLLDEMLSPAIATALRARGHDVEAIKEHSEWEARADPELVALARQQQRAIVTNNLRDFRPLHAELVAPGGAGHAGMIFVPTSYRLSKRDIGRITKALEAQLLAHPSDNALANSGTWL